MKIDVLQIASEGRNEFEIKYDDKLKYNAKLPFISIDDPLNLEKIRSIKITDLNGNEVYTTEYNYIENLKEEFIPLKYVVTGSQKFNQLLFTSDTNVIKVYYQENGVWDNKYIIESNDKKYICYSIADGYIRHLPIYDGNTQIGEILKSNVVKDGLDEYRCYLKDEYAELADGIVAFLLYLDRGSYNSSYIVDKSLTLTKDFTYNKTNKFYDKQWVNNNFGDEFYQKVEREVREAKEKLKNPIKLSKEQMREAAKSGIGLPKFVIIWFGVIFGSMAIAVLVYIMLLISTIN